MTVDIISRDQWGGESRPINKVDASDRTEFFVHYDGGVPITHLGNAIMHRIERLHLANGWKGGVGYNFVVDQQGNVYEGRGWNGVGAHCPNHNRSGIGVQVAIGGDQTPSSAALAKVRELYDEACERAGKTLAKKGHRDGKPTACPGEKLYAWVKAGFPAGQGAPAKPILPPVQGKTVTQLAKEVLAGQHGSGDQRKKSLGDQYDAVQAEVNRRLSSSTPETPKPVAPAPAEKTLAQLVDEVLAGKHGSGDQRKTSLGRRYDEVQAAVNRKLGGKPAAPKPVTTAPTLDHIELLAKKVIDGKYGSGDDRKRRLGRDYEAVQNRVNEILRRGRRAAPGPNIGQLAQEVIDGRWGSGDDRKRRLGANYAAVQAEVNRRLR